MLAFLLDDNLTKVLKVQGMNSLENTSESFGWLLKSKLIGAGYFYLYRGFVGCLHVQPINTPLVECRHVTHDVFWLKTKRRSATSTSCFHGSARVR